MLIERVTLDLEEGLTVLTGETGAGKSILLDGLGLALGARADASMVREGSKQAVACAFFELPPDHPVFPLLEEQGIAQDEPGVLNLRRTLRADGGSRAHVNDQPVSIGLLRNIGSLVVEIHGQHDERGLLNPRSHLALVDLYGEFEPLKARLVKSFRHWKQVQAELRQAKEQLERDIEDREWLEHAVEELHALAPQPGEERKLAEMRSRMQKGARLAETIEQIEKHISSTNGAISQLRQAARRLDRLEDESPIFQEILQGIDRALIEGDMVEAALASAREQFLFHPDDLDATEVRLFDLRGMARKHRVEVDDLADFTQRLEERLSGLDASEHHIEELEHAEQQARLQALEVANKLSDERKAAAARLDKAVQAELPALKLESARFHTSFAPVELTEAGIDQLHFEVATNNSENFGALTKIASGGELSRFILALKVALARTGSAGTLIFDEIDRGVGGATAAAIGARLARIASSAQQVLVVTHSPQVGAAGAHHFRIAKQESRTTITRLQDEERVEEIARMLSGADTTAEARAQASHLIAGFATNSDL